MRERSLENVFKLTQILREDKVRIAERLLVQALAGDQVRGPGVAPDVVGDAEVLPGLLGEVSDGEVLWQGTSLMSTLLICANRF